MKFTDGYWCVKKDIMSLYAVEYCDSRVNGDELTVYAPGRHISNRGDCLNLGMITIRLTSPMEDVIKVSVSHFEGTAYKGPFAQVNHTAPHVTIEETEDSIIYKSGSTKVFELLERERGEGEAVLFARSATVGGQKFPAHWGGDCSATYPSMAETIRSGLSLACAGFGFWSHDISGFEKTAPADIYKRWCQFGLLSSHSRLHGSSSYRVPWLFDEEACDVLRKFVKLKCALMPYLYRQAVKTHEEGIPMMRPMFVEFPEDRACETPDKQYMFGDSLLVAAVFKESGEVEYYLPEGRWVNLLTGDVVIGGKWKKEIHDYFSLPLLVRPNSILAVGSCDTKPDYDYCDGVKFCLSVFSEGASAIAEVTDLNGKVIMTAHAKRKGETIFLHVEGGNGNWSYEVLGDQEISVEME